MRFIRTEMRAHRQAPLTVPQFRALVLVRHNHDASLSALAEHLGLSLPAASRMVEGLVQRGLLGRQAQPGDRRRLSLSLTGRGRATCRTALKATQAALARRFGTLAAEDLVLVSRALSVLSRVFAPENCRRKSMH